MEVTVHATVLAVAASSEHGQKRLLLNAPYEGKA